MTVTGAPDADVIVVGGGPVGLVTAIEARLAGHTVRVVEHREGPVDKACGEGLMPGALPLLGRLGVAPHGMPLRGVRYTDGRRSAEHRFAGQVGLGVRRTVLRAALAERAEDLGIETVVGQAGSVEQDAEGVTIAVGGADRLRGRWLIGADGLHSQVSRELGLAVPSPRRRRRFGLRRHFRVEPWSDLVEVHWSPRGEVYVTPVDDRMVGIAVLARKGVGFDELIEATPELARRLEGADAADRLAGAGPFRQRTRRRVAGRALLVGDASGYVDAITGEGLRLGFEQARAAVARITADEPDRYEADWRRITRDFRRLTTGLVRASESPLRPLLVPAAERLPRVFAAAVESLAR